MTPVPLPDFTVPSVDFGTAPQFALTRAQRGSQPTTVHPGLPEPAQTSVESWNPLLTPLTSIFRHRSCEFSIAESAPLLFTFGQRLVNSLQALGELRPACPPVPRWLLIGYQNCPFWQGAVRRRGSVPGLDRVPASRSYPFVWRWWVSAWSLWLAAGRWPSTAAHHPTPGFPSSGGVSESWAGNPRGWAGLGWARADWRAEPGQRGPPDPDRGDRGDRGGATVSRWSLTGSRSSGLGEGLTEMGRPANRPLHPSVPGLVAR